MKSALLLIACGALLAVIVYRERRERQREAERIRVRDALHQRNREALRRFMGDLYAPAKPRVVNSEHGVFVRAYNEVEAAEIVSQSPAFGRRTA